MADSRDTVIEALADSEAQARNAGASYRLLAQQAIHQIHDLQIENQRLRRQLEHLRAEVRQLRQVKDTFDLKERAAA
jgi:hypothetical protein